MRISDWSSDVCSSDLGFGGYYPAYDRGDAISPALRFAPAARLEIAKAGALAPLDRGSSWPVRRYYERTAAWKRDVSVDGYLDRHRGNEKPTLMAGLLSNMANCLHLDYFFTYGWIFFFPPVNQGG